MTIAPQNNSTFVADKCLSCLQIFQIERRFPKVCHKSQVNPVKLHGLLCCLRRRHEKGGTDQTCNTWRGPDLYHVERTRPVSHREDQTCITWNRPDL